MEYTLRGLCIEYIDKMDEIVKYAYKKHNKKMTKKQCHDGYQSVMYWIIGSKFKTGYSYGEDCLTAIRVKFITDWSGDQYNDVDLVDIKGNVWAADFVDWNELSDLRIITDIQDKVEILVEIIWEMTYHGWTNEASQKLKIERATELKEIMKKSK